MPRQFEISFFICLLLTTTAPAQKAPPQNRIEQLFISHGLIDIHNIDATIHIDLVNSDRNKNFFGEDYYNGLQKGYLQKGVAFKLKKAQKFLKQINPDYSLLIMDAARPNSVSYKMYEKMKNTSFKHFVANPKTGSMHNFGAAVDVTIVDKHGKRIDMGFIPFYKGKWITALSYLTTGKMKVTAKQRKNRQLLEKVMTDAGFFPLAHEWWHFNGFSKEYIRKTYHIIK